MYHPLGKQAHTSEGVTQKAPVDCLIGYDGQYTSIAVQQSILRREKVDDALTLTLGLRRKKG